MKVRIKAGEKTGNVVHVEGTTSVFLLMELGLIEKVVEEAAPKRQVKVSWSVESRSLGEGQHTPPIISASCTCGAAQSFGKPVGKFYHCRVDAVPDDIITKFHDINRQLDSLYGGGN